HGGRWSIPLGFLIMAVFVTLVGVAAGYDSIVVFAVLYVPAVLATAFVIGPSQTFALSNLDREAAPHGVTVVSTSFQIAGCVGTSLAAGIYGSVTDVRLSNGASSFDALLSGFQGSVILVVLTSLLGIVLAVLAYRAVRSAKQVTVETAQSAQSVAAVMKTEVYTLQSDQTVLE